MTGRPRGDGLFADRERQAGRLGYRDRRLGPLLLLWGAAMVVLLVLHDIGSSDGVDYHVKRDITIDNVDYKDLRTLKVMITRDGHVLARRRTGNCAKFQRAVRRAILRARYMGLLPYVMRDD